MSQTYTKARVFEKNNKKSAANTAYSKPTATSSCLHIAEFKNLQFFKMLFFSITFIHAYLQYGCNMSVKF